MEKRQQKKQEEILLKKIKMVLDFIENAIENPAFWILGGGAIIAEVLGFIASKSFENAVSFPLWQFIILILGTLIAAAAIANRN